MDTLISENDCDFGYTKLTQQSNVISAEPQIAHIGSHIDPREKEQKRAEKQLAIILFIVGFFFFSIVVWPVNFFLHRKSKSKKARNFARLSLIAAIIVAILHLIFIAVTAVSSGQCSYILEAQEETSRGS